MVSKPGQAVGLATFLKNSPDALGNTDPGGFVQIVSASRTQIIHFGRGPFFWYASLKRRCE